MNLEQLFAEADEMRAAVEPVTVPVTLGKSTVGVRFLPLDAAGWRTLVAQHPARPDVAADLKRGYNIDAVTAAFPNVALIDEAGDVDNLMRPDAEGSMVYQWPAVWSRLTSTGMDAVTAELWFAHERAPELLVAAAGKASAG